MWFHANNIVAVPCRRYFNGRLKLWRSSEWLWPWIRPTDARGLYLFACGPLRGNIHFRRRRNEVG